MALNLKTLFRKRNKKVPNSKKTFDLLGNIEENTVSVAGGARYIDKNTINFFWKSSGNTVVIGENFKAKDLKIVFKGHDCELIIGDNVEWTGHILIVGENRKVEIGDNTVAKGVYILSREKDVTIGKNCLFSREIEIRTTDVHKLLDLDTGKRLNPATDIKIGDKVWIGARALISKGTKISDGSVVGAASFVNKKFNKKNVVIAGTPAKIVKENIYWER